MEHIKALERNETLYECSNTKNYKSVDDITI